MTEISDEQINNAINRSGYLLEYKVVDDLKKNGWCVTPNYVYKDSQTGTIREMDMVASYTVCDKKTQIEVVSYLIVECINNPDPFLIFERSPNRDDAIYDTFTIIKSGPLSFIKHSNPAFWEDTIQAAGTRQWHRYPQQKRGTQYCSFEKKKGHTNKDEINSWRATHSTSHFGALKGLQDATHHLREIEVKSIREGSSSARPQLLLYYPCFVLGGKMLSLSPNPNQNLNPSDIEKSLLKIGIIDNRSQNFEMFIDVVTRKGLELLSAHLVDEGNKLHEYLVSHTCDVEGTVRSVRDKLSACIVDREANRQCGIDGPEWPSFAC